MHVSHSRRLLLCLLVPLLSITVAAVPQRKEATIASGWVKRPAAGATTAEAFLAIVNPTAYDVVLQKPSSDAAGVIELRAAGKSEPLDFVTVPAYESLEMTAKGTYLLLRDIKKSLADGATVSISVMTDRGSPLTVAAVVKSE
jgi:copper(I)-binding protein